MTRILIPLLFLIAMPLQAGIELKKDGGNLKVHIDGKLFTEFRSDMATPCLYPLMSPTGTHLTRQYPFVKGVEGEQPDHPHHVGFWFTHGSVNGHDFWHSRNGAKIVLKSFGSIQEPKDDSSLSFTVNLAWEAKGKVILSEQRIYRIVPDGKTRKIYVTSILKPSDGDVTFGDTKEGSFAVRVAPTLRHKGDVAKGHITTSEGVKDGDAWGKRAKWVAYHGPDSEGTPSVVAILDHNKNLRHPTWWHARDYGLLTANPFGARAYRDKEFKGSGNYTIKKGESLTLKYGLFLHQGDLASAKLDDAWSAFTK